MITVAGMDPSLRNWGMSKFILDTDLSVHYQKSDLILTSPGKGGKTVRKNSQDLDSAVTLHERMHAFLEDVDVVCVEVPHGSQNARSAASYGICIGVLSSVKIPFIQVSATEVKLVAAQSKTATKQDIVDWAVKIAPDILDWGTKAEHIADSIAAVHAGMLTNEFKLLTTNYMRFIA